jgi:hypothetical protein
MMTCQETTPVRKQGDVSRRRRLVGPAAKIAWYARCRARRFASSDFKPHHHGCLRATSAA